MFKKCFFPKTLVLKAVYFSKLNFKENFRIFHLLQKLKNIIIGQLKK